ncbi:MAG: lipopolysaccharide biosynthesis protein [Chloroflexota bacterium]
MTDFGIIDDNNRVARKAGRGIIWNFLAYGLGKAVVLFTTSIIARLLTKDDIGLVAVALIAINYLAVVKDLGLGVALIQRREDVDEAANTVFTINLIIGILLSVVVVPIAPLVAEYFKEPMVTPVLRWLGVSFAINALGSVHVIWLMRELDYRRKFIPDMGNTLVKGVASIGLVFAGFGVWSLVIGQILGAITSVVLVWIVLPWRPRLMLNKKITAALMQFGASVIGGDILGVFIDNMDYIVIGRLFGLEQLGIYTYAYRLPEMLLIGNLWVMGSVTFSAFSSIQDKPDEMRRGLLASVRFIQMIAVPISLGLFLGADPIIRVVYGEQWLDVIPILRVLAIYAWVYSVGYHVGDVYKAIGRPDILFKLTILTLIVIVPFILIGSRFGMIGIAWGHLFAVLIRRVVSLIVAARFIKVPTTEILKELKPSIQGGAVMIPVVLIVLYVTKDISPFLQLAFVVLSGAVSYLGVLWVVERENLIRLARTIGVPL